MAQRLVQNKEAAESGLVHQSDLGAVRPAVFLVQTGDVLIIFSLPKESDYWPAYLETGAVLSQDVQGLLRERSLEQFKVHLLAEF
jgi:hypothetical protein